VRRQADELASAALLQRADDQASDRAASLEEEGAAWLRQAHDLSQRLQVADLLLEAALFRQESRGGHYRLDAPAPQPFWRCHSLQQRGQQIRTEPVGMGPIAAV
jgi:L-aspartate oxidase